jgi:hypothetical protein
LKVTAQLYKLQLLVRKALLVPWVLMVLLVQQALV